MMDKSASPGAITHYKRLSRKAWFAENRAVFIFFAAAFLLGLIYGAFGPLLIAFGASVGDWSPLFIGFVGGAVLALGVIFSARYVDRKLFGAMKAGILAVEDRIISGNSKTQMEDLEKLVAGYLKLKRMEAADYYSKQLLEVSKTGGMGIIKLNDWMVTTECWVSTKEYNRGWKYKLVWLFETRGVLTMSPSKLDFQSKKLNFTCSPANILSLEIKRHPLWLKPIPFRYISITIDEHGMHHTFYLTPSFGQTDTVWDCNRMVDVWYQRLQKMKSSAHPAGGFPDWLREVQG